MEHALKAGLTIVAHAACPAGIIGCALCGLTSVRSSVFMEEIGMECGSIFAYNIINGVRSSENAELLQGILRGEWGYEGMITTDWDNCGQHSREIKAGNDLKMPKGDYKNLREALAKGMLTKEEICVCVKKILEMILWLE